MPARSLFACLAVLVTACSDSGTTVGSTADAEHFCATLAKLSMDDYTECFKVAPAVMRDYADHITDTCALTQHQVDAGRATYDEAKGSACAHALAALPACAAYTAAMDPSADCRTAVRGTVPGTGVCWSGSDCADGYCLFTSQCSGSCFAFTMEGQPCSMTPCAPGLVCRWDHSSGISQGVCTAPSEANGPCPCKQGLFCDYGPPVAAGGIAATPTCQPQRNHGFCQFGDECAAGYVCAGELRTCVPLVGLGASCGAASQCGWGFYCDPATSACAAFPDLGQTCVLSRDGSTAVLMCMRGRCDAGGTRKCIAPKADGEPCSSPEECASYACDAVQQRCVGSGYVPQVCVPP